eukprot:55218_1
MSTANNNADYATTASPLVVYDLDGDFQTQEGRPTPKQLADAPVEKRNRFLMCCTVKLCNIKNDTMDADVRRQLLDRFKCTVTKVQTVRAIGATTHIVEFWNPKQATEFYEWLGADQVLGGKAIPKSLRHLFRMESMTVDKTDTPTTPEKKATTHCQQHAVHRADRIGDRFHENNAELDHQSGTMLTPCRFGFRKGEDQVRPYTPVPHQLLARRPTVAEFKQRSDEFRKDYTHACTVTISGLHSDVDAAVRESILDPCGNVVKVRSSCNDVPSIGLTKHLQVEMFTPMEAAELRKFLRGNQSDQVVAACFITHSWCLVAAGQHYVGYGGGKGDAILHPTSNVITTECQYGRQPRSSAATTTTTTKKTMPKQTHSRAGLVWLHIGPVP